MCICILHEEGKLCVYLLLHNKLPRFSRLKRHVFIILQFLWVANLGLVLLGPLSLFPTRLKLRGQLRVSSLIQRLIFQAHLCILETFNSSQPVGMKASVPPWLSTGCYSQFFSSLSKCASHESSRVLDQDGSHDLL